MIREGGTFSKLVGVGGGVLTNNAKWGTEGILLLVSLNFLETKIGGDQ